MNKRLDMSSDLQAQMAQRASDEVSAERLAIAPPAAARVRLLASLAGAERFTLFAGDVARVFGVAVDDARAALRLIQEPQAWQPGALPSIDLLITPALAQAGTVIARLAFDMRIPKHPHSAREITFVLDGLLIEDGHKSFGPGDVSDMLSGTEHAIEVAGAHACLAVFCPARLVR